jgi:hypothetical protein
MRLIAIPALCLALAGCGLIDSVSGPKSLSIKKFEASPEEVSAGASVTLSWEVEGAEQVAIQGIGSVQSKGSRTFSAFATTTYTLTARAGTSSATSSVVVMVRGSDFPSPSPSPSGTPSPSPTPTPSPTPSPEPDPTPTPLPTPTPTPTPIGSCGVPASTNVKGCSVGWEYPRALPDGQCIALNTVTVDSPCPVAAGTIRSIGFAITAKTTLDSLTWRSPDANKDVVSPAQGSLDVNGKASVLVSDTVDSDAVYLEAVDQDGWVRLRFRIKHRD